MPLSGTPSIDTAARTGIGRNTVINIVGAVVPIVVALAAVPAYLQAIGEARYGVLAVVWVVFGYFSVFEFGLARATANRMARLRDAPPIERHRLFWTALSLNAMIGAAGGAALLLLGRVVLQHVLELNPALRAEALAAAPWLAAGVPATTVTLVFVGTLEGRERFLTVNLLQVFGIVLFQLTPLCYAELVGTNLSGLIRSAMIALFVSTAVSFYVTARVLPVVAAPQIDRALIGPLLRFGGWVTVSGVVSPLLTVLDRLLIGALLGARSVTRYIVPSTLVTRLQLLAVPLARTLFPRLSTLEEPAAVAVGRYGLRGLVAVMTPIVVVGAFCVEPFLKTWVGPDIAADAAPVAEVLLVGAWANCVAVVPYAFLQARGRPDLPAKLHVLEAIPYVAMLIVGLKLFGIDGAAWAWTARVVADAVLLFIAAERVSAPAFTPTLGVVLPGFALVAISCMSALLGPSDVLARLPLGALVGGGTLWWVWRCTPLPERLRLTRPAASRGPAADEGSTI